MKYNNGISHKWVCFKLLKISSARLQDHKGREIISYYIDLRLLKTEHFEKLTGWTGYVIQENGWSF